MYTAAPPRPHLFLQHHHQQHHGCGHQAPAQARPPLAPPVHRGPGRGHPQQHRLLHVRQREAEHGKLRQFLDLV